MKDPVAERVVAGFLTEVGSRPGLAALLGGLVDRLAASHSEARAHACGGLVRDLALAATRGVPVDFKDVDLVVAGVDDRELEVVLEDLRREVQGVGWVERVGASFPVWKVKVRDLDEPVDVSVVRTRATFGAGRGHLATGSGSLGIADDTRHRDFTMNAMVVELDRGKGRVLSGRLVDLHGGLEAIDRGEIRSVGRPEDRFAEDPLRMLRAVRFAVSLPGFRLAPTLARAIPEGAGRLSALVARDRIADELYRVLAEHPVEAVELLSEVGLLPQVLPDLEITEGSGPGLAARRVEELARELGEPPRPPLLFAAMLLDLAEAEVPPTGSFWSSQVRGRRVSRAARELHLPDIRAIERLAAGAAVLRRLDRLECPDATLEELLGESGPGLEVVSLYRAAERAEGRQPADVSGRLRALPGSSLDFGQLVARLDLPAGPMLGRLRLALRQAEIEGHVPDERRARSILGRMPG